MHDRETESTIPSRPDLVRNKPNKKAYELADKVMFVYDILGGKKSAPKKGGSKQKEEAPAVPDPVKANLRYFVANVIDWTMDLFHLDGHNDDDGVTYGYDEGEVDPGFREALEAAKAATPTKATPFDNYGTPVEAVTPPPPPPAPTKATPFDDDPPSSDESNDDTRNDDEESSPVDPGPVPGDPGFRERWEREREEADRRNDTDSRHGDRSRDDGRNGRHGNPARGGSGGSSGSHLNVGGGGGGGNEGGSSNNDGGGSNNGGMDDDGSGQFDSWGVPIVLDLDGDGVELTPLERSAAFYDIHGNGYRYNMATAAADDGLLAYDIGNDGVIDQRGEISFVDYVEGAQTDLEGLRHFDSNKDGVLDANDAEFAKFKVWQDSDQDGEVDAGELRTLTEAGIRSIDMNYAPGDDGVQEERDGNVIFGEGNYTKADGTTAKFGDVALATSSVGVKEIAGEVHFKAADGVVAKMKTALSSATSGMRALFSRAENAAFTGAVGGAHADTLDGSGVTRDLTLLGGDGDDTLTGGSGNDWIAGGAGRDRLAGGDGHDVIFFGEDDLVFFDYSPYESWLMGGYVSGGAGNDVGIYSGNKGLQMDVHAYGFEAVVGGDGNDRLSTASGDVVLYGGDGDDRLYGAGGWTAGSVAGDDILSGDAGDDTLEGFGGDDVLMGGAGNDRLYGGAGNDVLVADAGDTIDGGDGWDTLIFTDDVAHNVNLATTKVERVFGGDGNDNFHINQSATSRPLHLYGGGGDDTLTTGVAEDTLHGGAGNDTLRGGMRDDVYLFNRGDGKDRIEDMASVHERSSADVLRFGAGISLMDLQVRESGRDLQIGVHAADGGTRFSELTDVVTIRDWRGWRSGVEFVEVGGERMRIEGLRNRMPNYIEGGAGGDTLTGTYASDVINGHGGDDRLDGGGGNDLLNGGAGADVLRGGAGDDTYHFNRGDGGDRIEDAAGHWHNRDVLRFGSGIAVADLLLEESGADLRIGVRAAGDTATAMSALTDVVTIRDWQTASSKVEFVEVGGKRVRVEELSDWASNNVIEGGSGSDSLVGGAGADMLLGSDGADILRGGAGDDILRGGDGADTYIFHRGDGKDRIEDTGVSIVADEDQINTLGLSDAAAEAVRESARRESEREFNARADTLRFGAGIALEDLQVRQSGSDLQIGVRGAGDGGKAFSELGDVVTIRNSWNIEYVEVGGERVPLWDLQSRTPNYIEGGAGGDSLVGTAGADVMIGGAGDDALQGGAGNDRYDFADGISGRNTVTDSGGNDVLDFSNMKHENIWFSRSGDDLRVRVLGTGYGQGQQTALIRIDPDGVLVKGHFASTDKLMESVRLGGGTLDVANIAALVDAMTRASAPGVGADGMSVSQRASVNSIWNSVGIAASA